MKKINRFQPLFVVLSFISGMVPYIGKTQLNFKHDTNYYEIYPNKLTGRIYLTQKYLHFGIPSFSSGKNISYVANAKTNLGIGVTWHNLSFNAFYGVKFLNNSKSKKGNTSGLNLQLHLFPKKWAIDVLGVFPQGYYIDNDDFKPTVGDYYYRPDIKATYVGISAYRVPNKEKFSYRAALIQNEWQKKSAGSVLYGGEAYYGTVKGDSALVPRSIQNNFPQAGITRVNFFRIGIGGGGAYTVVIDKHFFIMASVVGNIGLDFFKEKSPGSNNKKTSLYPSLVYKTALGYNSATWDISANVTGNQLWMKGASSNKNYYLPLGNIRLVLSKKFDIKKHKK